MYLIRVLHNYTTLRVLTFTYVRADNSLLTTGSEKFQPPPLSPSSGPQLPLAGPSELGTSASRAPGNCQATTILPESPWPARHLATAGK